MYCLPLRLSGKILEYVNEIKYLGITINANYFFDVNYGIMKGKFYKSFNAIYYKCKSNDCELVAVQLMQSYCVPLLVYAIEAMHLNSMNLNLLDKCI